MAESLHVLFVARPATLHACRWMEAIVARGIRCSLAAISPPGVEPPAVPGVQEVARLPVVPIRDPRYLPLFARNVWKLRGLARHLEPDILHAHFVEDGGWLVSWTGWHPQGITAWGSDLLVLPGRSRTGIGRWLTTRAVRKADFLTAPSAGLLDAARALGAAEGVLHRMLWGVDRKRFHPDVDGSAWRVRLDVPPGVPFVLSPRRMEPVYRIPDILDAWGLLKGQGLPGILVLATDGGSLEAGFRERVAAESWSESVRFLPPVTYPEMPALYAAADLVVSVPESDGTPMSVLESLASACPVIASDLPSLHPWVLPDRTGLRVPVGDTGALAGALARLMGDADLRRRLGEEGAGLIATEADQGTWMDRAAELYRRAAGVSL